MAASATSLSKRTLSRLSMSMASSITGSRRGARKTDKHHQPGPDELEKDLSEEEQERERQHAPEKRGKSIFMRWSTGQIGGAADVSTQSVKEESVAELSPAYQELFARTPWSQHVAYFLDRVLAKRWSFFLALAGAGLVMVLLFAFLTTVAWGCKEHRESMISDGFRKCHYGALYAQGLWLAWTWMADPGQQQDATNPRQKIVGSIITVGGIVFMAAILGVTVDMVREKMDSLRQGKSRIVEKNHTLILGWTEKTLHIIEELINANESEGGGVVAVLAPFPKEVMESELALQLPHRLRKRTRVIFRHGSPLVLGDLVRVSVQTARAILVLASTGEADRADADTLRTMLLLRTMNKVIRGHVVAEVRDIDNEPLVSMVGGHMADTLVSHDMIGRLMLLSARQPGLAKVYEALLGFEGDEFYREEWPQLVGLEFKGLQRRFPDAIPIGVYTTTQEAWLSPHPTYKLKPGDQVMVLAEDNDTYAPAKEELEHAGEPPPLNDTDKPIEKILFCGWRRDIRDLFQQLDKFVKFGSEVHMMTHCIPLSQRMERLLEDGLDVRELKNLVIVHQFGNTSVRRKLEALPMETYTSCMIFADQVFEADTMHADSHSLATLLLIRDIQANRFAELGISNRSETVFFTEDPSAKANRPRCSQRARSSKRCSASEAFLSAIAAPKDVPLECPIVCEILDPHTQRTIADSKQLSLASDFCQTNRLVAQVLTMIAEDRTVKGLLDELLGSNGVSIAVVQASRYCYTGEMLSFNCVVDRAFAFDEIVIGFQARRSIEKTVLNPPEKHIKHDWTNFDFAVLEKSARQNEMLCSEEDEEDDIIPRKNQKTALELFRASESRKSIREVVRDIRQGTTPSDFDVLQTAQKRSSIAEESLNDLYPQVGKATSSLDGYHQVSKDGTGWASGGFAGDGGFAEDQRDPSICRSGSRDRFSSDGGVASTAASDPARRVADLARDFLRRVSEAPFVDEQTFAAAAQRLSEGERTKLTKLLEHFQRHQRGASGENPSPVKPRHVPHAGALEARAGVYGLVQPARGDVAPENSLDHASGWAAVV